MRLLVVIVHLEDVLDDVLSALFEVEAPDAVVINQLVGPILWERGIIVAGEDSAD